MSRSHLLVSFLFCLLLLVSPLAPTVSSQGPARSLSLNGSQYVAVPSSASLNITGAITVEAWVKLNSIGAYQVIASREAFQQPGTGGGYRLTITSAGKLDFTLFQSHNTYVNVVGVTTVSAGAWHHVAGIFNGSQMKVFVDGVMDGSLSTTSGPASGTSSFYIGRNSYVYSPYYFTGLIDEVRVSAAALYSGNFTPGLGPGSNVRGLWKFDGPTVNDFSSNGNNGTLQNGASYSTDVPPVTNNAPSVSLSEPQNNTTLTSGSNVVVQATAADSDGSIARVDFYQGTTLLGTDTSAPYLFVWSNVPAGVYSLTAKAVDDAGATTTSTALTLTVIAPGANYSLSLNGTSQYVLVPSSESLNITGPITVEAWIKINSLGAYQVIVSREAFQQPGTGGGYRLTITSAGKLDFTLFQSHNTYVNVVGVTTVSAGAWHHVAGVFNGTAMKVFVDGVLDGSMSTTSGPTSGTGSLYIGRNSYIYSPYYFGGLIDEVRVSAAALYSTNFTRGLGPASNTRGLWKFDSQTTEDYAGAANNGTLPTGAAYSPEGPPTGGSSRPFPVAGGPYSAQVGQPVQFSSAGTFDPDGAVQQYHWSFGDGTAVNAPNPTNVYQLPGLYTATLTVTDNSGLLASATAIVTIVGAANARLDPMNQTGGDGENPLSQNFSWRLPLVSLPGRGVDLSLSLWYNSLLWIKTDNNISFDDDRGFPGPGFRLGFPVIQAPYYNSEVGKNAFLLIGSDGSRTELRQVGTSTLYEAADSSYLLLDANTMVLRATDGTQLKYEWKGSEYNCTEVKDRNGNYISVLYNAAGRVDTVVDTLARSIRFNYDSTGSLSSITQTWNQGTPSQTTHNWATFEYTNVAIQTSFSGLTVSGPSNGSTIKTLARVRVATGAHYDFNYTAWGQIWKIAGFAADEHQLHYRAYNLPGSPLQATGPQSDCPKFTERRDWAENFNKNISGIEQEALTAYATPTPESWTNPDGTTQSGLRAQVTAPDLTTVTKLYFSGTKGTASGWRRGLPALVNTYSNGVLQRQVMTTWTQDNTSVSYPLNPRVVETNTFDPAGNRARVQTTYQQITFANGTSCQLPRDVHEYAANPTTVLRSTRTDYNTSSTYTDRRLIGLVSERRLYEGDVNNGGVLLAKVGLFYDGSAIQGNDAPVQHDNVNYSASFLTGRGNLSSVRRYDATNTSQYTTSSSKHNTAGAPVSTTDASLHTTQFAYADSFSDGVSRNTFAYVTTVTDADGYSATAKYNFDFGAVTYKRTPQPNTTQNLPGPEQTLSYDQFARLQQITNQVTGAYTRYEYANSDVRVDTYRTIEQGLGEAHSFRITDGTGQVIATATDHPGSVGGYTGQRFVYNVLGQVTKTSNPTETNASGAPSQWAAAGDDAASGWLFTEQTFDWKGRPLVTTNPDLTTKTASYAGCGCAGGQITTLTDEGTLDAGVLKRRQQKIYSDVLGRTVKTENLNWQGGSVYSTTVTTYNARDQVMQVREYAGAEGSGTYQDTLVTYDGYGRLKSKHVPEQSEGTATVWTYNADDSIDTVTDARGAVSSFAYNARHLATSVTHTFTGQPNVTAFFTFDAAGNRTAMTDGLGTTTYSFDQLSRLTSETRGFTGVGNYTIGYQYNLANDLSSLTAPSNITFTYTRDASGRLTSITRPGQTLASAISYRASGAMKHMLYGDNSAMDVTFNARLLPATFNIPGKISKTYSYYNDGALRFSSDALDHRFDRSYGYDQAGRLTSALSGAEARGEGTTTNRPYNQTYTFDAFSNLTQRTVKNWWTVDTTLSQSYTKNRRAGWEYDADGRATDAGDVYSYDAAGRNGHLEMSNQATATMAYDPEGRQIKTIETFVDENFQTQSETRYYVRSTVLGGQVLAEVDPSNTISRTYVYAGPATLGWITHTNSFDLMNWEQRDPSGATVRGIGEKELDPLGADAGTAASIATADEHALISFGSSYNPENPAASYSIDGIRVPLEDVVHLIGLKFKDPLALLDEWAHSSGKPIAVLNKGARFGERYEVLYDLNGKILDESWKSDSSVAQEIYGKEYLVYSNAGLPDPFMLSQQGGFRYAGPSFRAEQKQILDPAYKRINQDDCKTFINETLAKYKVGKDFDSLEKLLNKATLSYYDTDANYDNTDLNVSSHDAILLVDDFGRKQASAVTVGSRVFLSDKVFTRTDYYFYSYKADTSSYIVHELLHVAGIDKSIVDSQAMTDDIRAHCRTPGSDRIVLSP